MIDGKGIMIWKGVNYGTLTECVQACVDMGLRWVALKIGDAASTTYRSFPDMAQAVAAFRAAGIKVWLWHYIYGGIWIDKAGVVHVEGASPAQEAVFAKQQVSALGGDGYIIDAEREYKVYNQTYRAASFVSGIANIGVPVALCSYRFPSLHATFPWATFLTKSDIHMPQVYHGPGRGIIDLERSYSELMAKRVLPFVPVGRAYIGDGYPEPGPSADEMTQFMTHAENKGCPGISWWAMDFLKLHMGGPARQAAISAYQWADDAPPPQATLTVPEGKNIRVTPNGVDCGDTQAASGLKIVHEEDTGGYHWYTVEVSIAQTTGVVKR